MAKNTENDTTRQRSEAEAALNRSTLVIAKRIAAQADELAPSEIRDLAESLRIVHGTVLRPDIA